MPNFVGKTPVSVLEEYSASVKIPTHYELIKNWDGTHNPEFIYRAQIGSSSELGSGRSKQEAKQKAAENLLIKLNLINKETDQNGENEVDLKQNFVGELKQYCIDNHHPEVKYHLEETAGPPHCMVFKIVCCVSQLQDFGISRTKKQAKQIAAFKMLERLKKLGGHKPNGITDSCMCEAPKPKIIQPIPEKKLTDEEIEEKYNAARTLSAPVVQDPAAYYKDYHKAYINLHEKSATLSQLLKLNSIESDKALDFSKEIAKELEVALKSSEIPVKDEEEGNYFVVTMTTVPPLAGLGNSEQNAALELLKSLLIFS